MTEAKVGARKEAGTRRAPVVFLLDTAAILEGASLTPSACITVPEVVAEVRPGGPAHRLLENFLAAGMEVRMPTLESLGRVEATAKKAGNWSRLSGADAAVLALGLDVPGARLVSDDHTVLDLASRLLIPTQTVRTGGITATKDWAARCAGCARTYDATKAGSACPVCGSEIKLKPKRPRARSGTKLGTSPGKPL